MLRHKKFLIPAVLAVLGTFAILVGPVFNSSASDVVSQFEAAPRFPVSEVSSEANAVPFLRASTQDVLDKPNPLGEITLGVADAPVTIVEYASLTCGHCGAFHTGVLPTLKEEYVDTGKVRFLFRPFPLDPYAMTGAMLAQCVAPAARVAFLDTLFRRQSQWVRSDDPLNSLRAYAKQAGLSGENFVLCLRSEDNLAAIRGMFEDASKELDVQSTPTFFVNGKKVQGNVGIEEFREIINKALPDDMVDEVTDASATDAAEKDKGL